MALENEFGRLMNNRDLEGSVMAYRNAERSQFESLLEQKMLNIQMKMKSQFDRTAHRIRT